MLCFHFVLNYILDRKNVEQNYLFNLIGSEMLSVYRDAKKITLSAWSWPSRLVADQLSTNFKEKGKH